MGYNLGELNPSNTNKFQTFQSKYLRQIANALFYVSNGTLHGKLNIPTTKIFYKRFHSNLSKHHNPSFQIYQLTLSQVTPKRA